MINAHIDFVAALNTVLPTHHELVLHEGIPTPCISYRELQNMSTEEGDTLGYSKLAFQVKVWGNDIGLLNEGAMEIDAVLRPLGWKRTNSNELYDINSTMIQRIMTYEAIGLEEF